ncbi:hypothetical protein V2I01_22110 [Micromonospora sp. BRA006-A]|nr:hypothetical protein [Micromonospora sp. BRA006-A]
MSIGVAAGQREQDVELLLRSADLALRYAKQRARTGSSATTPRTTSC